MSTYSTVKLNSNVTVLFDKGNNSKRCLVSVFVNDFELLTPGDYSLFLNAISAYRVLNPSVEQLRISAGGMTLSFLNVYSS